MFFNFSFHLLDMNVCALCFLLNMLTNLVLQFFFFKVNNCLSLPAIERFSFGHVYMHNIHYCKFKIARDQVVWTHHHSLFVSNIRMTYTAHCQFGLCELKFCKCIYVENCLTYFCVYNKKIEFNRLVVSGQEVSIRASHILRHWLCLFGNICFICWC